MVFMQQIVKNAPRFYHFWYEDFLKHFYVYNLKKKNNNNITTSIQKHTTNTENMFKNKLYSLLENHKPLHCPNFKSIDTQQGL